MMTHPEPSPAEPEDFDFSTPEALAALNGVTELVLEIRQEVSGKLELYERTLGLAVIPVLIRRALIILHRKLGRRSRSLR